MDRKVKWSPEALEDLEAIAEYVALDSLHYASAIVSKMLSVSRSVGEFPLIGRIVPELMNPDIL